MQFQVLCSFCTLSPNFHLLTIHLYFINIPSVCCTVHVSLSLTRTRKSLFFRSLVCANNVILCYWTSCERAWIFLVVSTRARVWSDVNGMKWSQRIILCANSLRNGHKKSLCDERVKKRKKDGFLMRNVSFWTKYCQIYCQIYWNSHWIAYTIYCTKSSVDFCLKCRLMRKWFNLSHDESFVWGGQGNYRFCFEKCVVDIN